MSRRLVLASFDSEETLLAAAAASQGAGAEPVDARTPYPVHGIDALLGIPRSRLPLVCFVGGLSGLVLGMCFQHWSSAVDWPLNVGGKPFLSLPAFVPVAFELTVLLGGLSTAAALLVRSRLWPGKRVDRSLERAGDDRFVLVLRARDATLSAHALRARLAELGALESWEEIER